MTDILTKLDDAQRKYVEDQKRRAADHPFQVVFGVFVGQIINCLILHRLGKRWGFPLRRLHWWLLLACFGRDPGYPYNLIWQVRPTPVEDAFRVRHEAAQKLLTEILKARDVQAAKRDGQPRHSVDDVAPRSPRHRPTDADIFGVRPPRQTPE